MGPYYKALQIHILMEVDRFRSKLVSSGSDNAHKLEQTNALAYYEVRNVYSTDPWPTVLVVRKTQLKIVLTFD